jgi:hypothetical protein
MLAAGLFYETQTDRDALLPAQLLKMKGTRKRFCPAHQADKVPFTWLTVVVLVASFLHNAAFTNGTFFLALYFQVRASHTSREPF